MFAVVAVAMRGVLRRADRRQHRRSLALCRGHPAPTSVRALAGEPRLSATRALSTRDVAAAATASADVPKPPRVRFAPSPTGVLHVGGARTALFNWLFAKSLGGKMVLRIEDTDEERSTAESEAAILESLRWCGIDWDEGPDIGGPFGPYRQTDRIKVGIYQRALEKLLADGKAYRCFLTGEELDAMRERVRQNDQAFVVDSPWSRAPRERAEEMLAKGAPFVYRFRVPKEQNIVINDLVLGDVEKSSDDIGGDFVIVRGSGVPMYNFCVVVDDAQMEITHVFRAQEHLENTPKQLLLYEALGLSAPAFGHMPLILSPTRAKLSKRDGAVAVGDYMRQGYLPSGMVNYLAQLGWNDGTNKEIYDPQELVEAFKLERMSKVAAIFDHEKLKWVNGHHVRRLSDDDAVRMIGAELVKDGIVKEASGEFVRKASLILKERISVLSEAGEALRGMLAFDLGAMLADDRFQEWVTSGAIAETAKCLSDAQVAGDFEALGRDPDAFKTLVKRISKARGGVKKKALLAPLRLCLTSDDNGPNMELFFDMLQHVDDNVLCEPLSLDARLKALSARFGAA